MPRRQPWFNLDCDVVRDERLRQVAPSQRWLWIVALTAAHESPIPHKLMLTEKLPVSELILAEHAGMRPQDVKKGMQLLQQHGLVEWDATFGAWSIPSHPALDYKR